MAKKNCLKVATAAGDQDEPFSKTHIKLYVPVVTLSTRDNSELFKQLTSGFNRTINWNKYQWKISTERLKKYLDDLIDLSPQGVNRFFVLSFEDEAQWISYKRHYFLTVKIKNYNDWWTQMFWSTRKK